jgi:hypothetical protein
MTFYGNSINSNGYYTVGYADDIAILINGKFPHTVAEVVLTTQCTVQNWCENTNLSINPNKMVTINFSRKRGIKGLKWFLKYLQKNNPAIQEIKYLGITSDKGIVGTSHSPNAQSLPLRSMWEHPTVQHTILTPSVENTIFTPNSISQSHIATESQ